MPERQDQADKLTPTDRLRTLRDSWSDEIPEEIIHSNSRNNRFKVRKNWFQGVTATLEEVLEGIDDEDFEKRIKIAEFVTQYTSPSFKDKPLTEESDIYEANEMINFVLGERPAIDVAQLDRIHTENVGKTAELLESLNRTIDSPSYRRSIGLALFGSFKKVTKGPNGEEIEEDWTQEEIDAESDRQGLEHERDLKDEMAKHLKLALQSQIQFFSTTEHPMTATANTNVDMILALTERFLASKEDVFEEYPVMYTEDRKQAQALEVVRQTILKPVSTFYENIEVNEDAWEFQTVEMTLERDMTRWRELEQKRIEQGLKDRDEEEWVEVVLRLDNHLTEYIKGLAVRTVNDRREIIEFGSRLIKDGEKIVNEQNISSWQQEADAQRSGRCEH